MYQLKKKHNISQFADDMIIYLDNLRESTEKQVQNRALKLILRNK